MDTKIKHSTGREFVITREFDAPRELVFKAWTDPKHLAQWWGPRGFTNPVCDWNARPDLGREFVITREFDAPRELVFKAWTDPKHLAQWWGPRGFTNPVCDWNARP